MLKRRLGQGGFGETWLASYLNCSNGENAVVSMHEDQEVTLNSFCLDPWNLHSDYSSSTNDCHSSSSSSSYGDSFIIKRVMLIALKFCHDRSIINRDIKPGNMVICVEDETNGTCLEQRPSEDMHFHTKISKQTYYYTPPEALLNASWFQGSTSTALKYDLWSVGVVALEMIVGTPYVFQLSHRSYAVIILQSDSLHEDEMNLLFRFRSFAALCNKMPTDSEHLRGRRERIARSK